MRATVSLRSCLALLDLRTADDVPPPVLGQLRAVTGDALCLGDVAADEGGDVLEAVVAHPLTGGWLVVTATETTPPPPPPPMLKGGRAAFAALSLPTRTFRICIETLAPNGGRTAASAAVVCSSEGGETDFAFDEELRQMDDGEGGGGGGAPDADTALLVALSDRGGRLFVSRRGSERVLVFEAASGDFIAAIDTPRLRALAPLLGGHVAIHADGGIHIYSPDWSKSDEIAHEQIEGCVRMAYDALKGRLICLVDDSAAGGDSEAGLRFSLVAVTVAGEAKPAVLLPTNVMPGRKLPWERSAARVERVRATVEAARHDSAAAEAPRPAPAAGASTAPPSDLDEVEEDLGAIVHHKGGKSQQKKKTKKK